MRRILIVTLGVALMFGSGTALAAGTGDVQLYAGANIDVASGSIDFSVALSVLVLDVPTDGRWEIRDVTLAEDALTTDPPAFVRVACWFTDADGLHPFASFRILATPSGSGPFGPPAQQPVWLEEALPGQVWCGAGRPGATITFGMMSFRFNYAPAH